jgi:hypothetical protein
MSKLSCARHNDSLELLDQAFPFHISFRGVFAMRAVLTLAFGVFFLTATLATAGGPTIASAHGVIEKAEKDSLTVQPREAGGQFGKKLVLKVTGTSKVATVSMEKRAGKTVPVQRDTDAGSLEAGQPIVVIFVAGAEPVLLSAVAQKK